MDRQPQLQTGVLFIGWIATAACAGGVPSGPAALTLTGAPQVEVRLLQPPRLSGSGVVPGIESADAFIALSPAEERRAKDALTKLFAQARWVFLPDGSFRFIPSTAADVRDDLYPLIGSYRRRNGTIEFRASRRSPLGPTASLDGVIHETKTGGLLDAVHAVAGNQVRMASLCQELSPLAIAAEEPSRIAGVPAPAVFSVTLSGQVDGEALPPRTADLRILRPEAGRAASVGVQLDTVGAIDAGTLNWWSPAKGTARHRLSVEGGRVSVEVEGAGGDTLAPTWWAPDREAPIATLSTPHAADRGRLRFSVQGDEVTGEIEAVGASNLDPAHREKTYRARFQGRRRDPAGSPPPAIPVGDAVPVPAGETAGPDSGPFELAGHFVLEDGTGKGEGNLTLARDGSLLRGTLETAGHRHSYTGHEERGRADLIRDDGSTAYALRSVAGGELMVGLTKAADAKRPRAVVARRLPTAPQPGETAVAVDDADELRRQGMDLVLAGRCGVARAPLQRSLSIYRRQAEATDGKTYKPLILTQMEQVLMLLADCDLRQEDYAAYLDDLQQGAKLLPALRAAEVAQPLVPWRAAPPSVSGAGERQENISDSAIQAANRLAQQPDRLWARTVKDPIKVDLLEKLQSFFGELVLVLLQANQKGAALVVSETARSRALLDLLAARKEIKAGSAISSTAAGKGLPSPTTVTPLSLEELLDIVRRRGSTTIEYFLTEKTLAIWVISPGGAIDAVTVPLIEHFPAKGTSPRVALAKAIDELHGLLDSTPTSSTTGASDRARTAELLRQLHGLLIGSIPERLLPSSAEAPLTIIPHAELLGVPFAALRDASSRYFIESHTLVYGPSLAVLKYSREDRERLRHREPRLLALVNPRPMPIAEDGKRWNDLRELEANFTEIAGFYPEAGRRVLVGENASKAALLAHAKEATELCLVTHAKFLDKPSDPLDSYIALAAGATPEDGYLRVPEVFRLELQAELVLLWACESGRGRFSGDGVQGLSRAFIWAGSPNLMLSLWSVAPKASAMQMYGFHQLWRQKGHSLAQALRLAQLEQMELYRDQPGVWAAFVLYGEGN